MTFNTPLPIDEVLDDLTSRLREGRSAVVVAPPGAGKTTRIPLALLKEPWRGDKRILVLEPRRLAARSAAMRMASERGETLGETVGLRVRLGSQIGPKTRIEVVTEGIFTRMILDDPELSTVAAVLFDEFHERSLDADLGLALALDAQRSLNPDLRIVVMSATLDGARIAALMDGAALIESEGRSFPVETRYRGRDPSKNLDDEVLACIRHALAQDEGSILVFLPGQGEIIRLADRLQQVIQNPDILIAPLYGSMDPAAQDLAVRPCPHQRRKVVLATSIAETSLTIEDVRIVIDSGLSRVPRYEPDIGMTRLETVRVSRASADQRRGRAGRIASGIAYRLWEEAANGALDAFQAPEIMAADLSSFLLDCAAWGETDPRRLTMLDPPPVPALNEARQLLQSLDALDETGRLTEQGRLIRALPLPPRLATMMISAQKQNHLLLAGELAAVLTERGLGGDGIDLAHRIEQFRRDRGGRAKQMRRLVEQWMRMVGDRPATTETHIVDPSEVGAVLALAFPDRVAKARGPTGTFLMANGRAASVPPHDALARCAFLAVAEVTGRASSSRIMAAAPLEAADLERLFASHIRREERLSFDPSAMALRCRAVQSLGALTLSERMLPVPDTEEAAHCLARGLAETDFEQLPWSKSLKQWRDRVEFLRRVDPVWPDLSDDGLRADGALWLAPALRGVSSVAGLPHDRFEQALKERLDWSLRKRLDQEAPTHFMAPTGQAHPIDYEAEEGPVLAIRVQELFGLTRHPSIAGGRLALVLHLLSPAHRPIQITRDLPGFWAGSWAAVKSEMKGRYPRHVWPDDPASAVPTMRAKPRGT
jgi:ATP-dependent helicase HrpB